MKNKYYDRRMREKKISHWFYIVLYTYSVRFTQTATQNVFQPDGLWPSWSNFLEANFGTENARFEPIFQIGNPCGEQ